MFSARIVLGTSTGREGTGISVTDQPEAVYGHVLDAESSPCPPVDVMWRSERCHFCCSLQVFLFIQRVATGLGDF